MNDCRLSGSQQIGGGEYARVLCSGSLKISSDLKCEKMKISGSCNANGSVNCNGELDVSGSFSADGDITAADVENSGSMSVGSFKGGSLNSSGSFSSKGGIKATNIEISGSISCASVDADSLNMIGKISCYGQINSDIVDIRLSSPTNSCAESVVGSNIKIRRHLLGSFFGLLRACFKTGLIEGDNIDLESVEAKTVRGNDVKIGKRCIIERVEYSSSADIDNSAKIGEMVKI